MKKKLLISASALLGLVIVCAFLFKSDDEIIKDTMTNDDIVKIHKENLEKSPFKEALKLSKKERKALSIPPNKYYEEEWELTMNPIEGRPTTENLESIREFIQQSSTNRTPGNSATNSWVERGPNNVGGRTRAIMFDPNDPTNETVFAGGVSGGLWKNTNISNPASKWSRVNISKNLAVTSITADPNNDSVFYLGTGESYVSGDVNGDGVWKSEDGGDTWTNIFGGISGPTTFVTESTITVDTPASIAGDYLAFATTNFGSQVTSEISADFVLVDDGSPTPTLGCGTGLVNGAQLAGNIALIRRGNCPFVEKVKNAQDAGAIGAIVLNNNPGEPIAMGGEDATITIPAVMITKEAGDAIENALSSGTVTGSMNPPTGDFTGNLVPGIQHINDLKIKNNGGVSEIYVAAGETFYSAANSATFMGGPELGLYKSVDGGASWVELNMPLTEEGNKHEPNDIEIGADGKIWVSTIASSVYGDGGGKIFSSDNDGATFTDTFTVPDGNRTQIAVSSQNANTIYVLAQVAGGVALISTNNAFTTTTDLALPNDADTGIPENDFTRGQAFYDLVIEVDPTNDQKLYTGGIDLFDSTNGGTSWEQISKWSNNNLLAGLNVPLVHADQHALVFAPGNANRILFGNDGGVYFSNDGGAAITSRNVGFNVTQFYTVGVAPTTAYSDGLDHFLAGAQDNGTQLFDGVAAGENSSISAFGGDGAYSFFDQDGTDQYYITNFVYNRIIRLVDQATNITVVINNESGSNGSFINPQALDSNLDILYSNYSSTFENIVRRYSGIKSSPVPTNLTDDLLTGRPTALTVSPYTTTSSTLLVGTVLGDVLKVENADGAAPTWSNLDPNNGIVGSISDVEFGVNENQIFATIHNYGVQSIWYTNDGGATWQQKEGDLPDMPVKAILQSPLNPNVVIVGTELGVWTTNNFNATSPNWVPAFNGMSDAKVTDLDLRDDNKVFASTYGRGVFSGDFSLNPDGDEDGDGILNGVDNCVNVANPDQADADGNGIGDACQDTDGDTILDINDNCPDNANTDQADTDGNGVGDACQDTDGDGIFDSVDNCINTPNPNQADGNGDGVGDFCDTSFEAPDAITLEVISETCEGEDNGMVRITFAEDYLGYGIAITGNGINIGEMWGGPGNMIEFDDLPVGAYTVCVEVVEIYTDYVQCFEINIDAAEPLDGVFSVANDSSDGPDVTTSVNINTGTPPYTVVFNEEVVMITSETSFNVETLGSGIMEVRSSKACEGVMSTFVEGNLNLRLTASPNPVVNNLKIAFPSTEAAEIQVQVFSVSGKLMLDTKASVQNSNYIQVPFESFNNGMYFIKLNLEKPEVLKIIKK